MEKRITGSAEYPVNPSILNMGTSQFSDLHENCLGRKADEDEH